MPLPVKKGRGGLLYDEHVPYQDNNAISIAVRWLLDNQYDDFIVFGGDLVDCYQLSPFVRDPRKRKFKQDLDDVKKFFDAMRRAFPNALFIWKEGNHERWLKLYLMLKAPEIFDLDGGKWIWDDYLGLKERGIIRIDDDIPLKVGKLNIIHGHELRPTNNTVNAARGAYLKAIECIILGHWHRTSEHAETSFSGRLDTAWGVGCLCNLHPDYARINKWNHGFAGLEVDGTDFTIENKRIVKGLVR
jgi:predicted phosphodiesterase